MEERYYEILADSHQPTEEPAVSTKVINRRHPRYEPDGRGTDDRGGTLPKQREQLLAAVAHGLRGPLGVIELVAEKMVEDGDLNAAKTREFLQMILSSCRDSRHVLDMYLVFSALECGNLALHPRRVKIRQFVSAASEAGRRPCEAKGVP